MIAIALCALVLIQPAKPEPVYTLTASTYGYPGDRYHAGTKRMANGQRFRPDRLTAAVDPRRLKEGWSFGTRLIVWTRNPDRRVVVTVTDTMNRRFRDAGKERIDLSWGAWNEVTGNAKPGLRQVRVQRIEAEK
jgi:rare lipoprotein A (peptidoglycan hydrolase)